MTGRIYLDHAATSPLRPAARDAMAPWWGLQCGNAASPHAEGRAAKAALADARRQVAALAGARPEEVVFTSGATEASNLAIRGGAHMRRSGGRRVSATRIEHAASSACLDALATDGYEITLREVDAHGRLDALNLGLPHGTAILTVIAGHNELGTMQQLDALAEAAHRVGALLHLDAVQTAGYVDLSDVSWDLLSLSAHKIGGPQGVGALIRRGLPPVGPILVGSSQEFGLRPGTVPIALAVGFGAAAEQVLAHRPAEAVRLAALRDRLGCGLLDALPGAFPLGTWWDMPEFALPQILPVALPELAGDEVVHALDAVGVAASSASACLSGARSGTLDAIGLAASTSLLRLSLGWTTDEAAVVKALSLIPAAIQRLKATPAFERRRGPLERQAAGVVALTDAHWEAAEAVWAYYQENGILPGARTLAKNGATSRLAELFPYGLSTLALWLGLPVPRGGCRPYAG